MNRTKVNYLILGAGIAGLSLAHSLYHNNRSVAVIDHKGIGSGASGTPGGLLNPVTGRRAKLCWRPEACYQAVTGLISETERFADSTLLHQHGILRPGVTDKIGRKMHQSYNKQQWPENWVNWLNEQQIRTYNPLVNVRFGGIRVDVGGWINIGTYLQNLSKMLLKAGCPIQTIPDYTLKPSGTKWLFESPHHLFCADFVIFATGSKTVDMDLWQNIPLHPLKGQVAAFTTTLPLEFNYGISSLGYFIPYGKHTLYAGSTYEHHYNTTETTHKAVEVLKNKVLRTFPALKGYLKLKKQWAGVRVSTPDKMPVAGRHPDYVNAFLFTGLGSKGLLYGKYIADLLAKNLLADQKLPQEIDIKRFMR